MPNMTRKEAILDAATHLFATRGYKDTSTSEVSRITGVAEGTLFYHFKTKEELFLAILKNVQDSILESFATYLEGHSFTSGLEMLEAIVSFYLYLAGQLEDGFLLLHRYFPYKMAQENAQCRHSLQAVFNSILDVFEAAIERGRADGSIAEVDPRKTALIVFTLADGLSRLRTFNLYDAGTLYNELLAACRKIVTTNNQEAPPC